MVNGVYCGVQEHMDKKWQQKEGKSKEDEKDLMLWEALTKAGILQEWKREEEREIERNKSLTADEKKKKRSNKNPRKLKNFIHPSIPIIQ